MSVSMLSVRSSIKPRYFIFFDPQIIIIVPLFIPTYIYTYIFYNMTLMTQVQGGSMKNYFVKKTKRFLNT